MNRKNLTAAVLAGLAGAAGIAGTAQAVNMNPDGLGQVLIYPYYTTNDGNQTILSVVNTTDSAKAVKVRFLEGFNSREVLDFNLYLSHHDVWVAAIADSAYFGAEPGVPHLAIPDDSCTVPYLYDPDFDRDGAGGLQPFLDIAYSDNGTGFNFEDGGPTGIARSAEGHFEMIEMGTIKCEADADGDCTNDTYLDITHKTHKVLDDDGDVVETYWAPGDCKQLTTNWTRAADYSPLGMWTCDDPLEECEDSAIDISRNSGGLFGGAAIVNPENGTMYSYNAAAIQGFDKTSDGIHFEPGTIRPSLDSGDQDEANVFFGAPTNDVVQLTYPRTVDAVSALFMHEYVMNEYTTSEELAAATEWVVTFPTKNFYVDELRIPEVTTGVWVPDGDDPECNSWVPGEPFPPRDDAGPSEEVGWEGCSYILILDELEATKPFTEIFQDEGMACELVGIQTWDRDERTFVPDDPTGVRPPVVSPSIPGQCNPDIQVCETTQFELCYEVNVLRFGDESIFGTPDLDGASLLVTVDDEFTEGWGRLNMYEDPKHVDYAGLVGLPVTGFSAYEFENEFLGGGDIKAFYGGLFGHKGNVRRIFPEPR